jgi:uncharacterized membrane protein YesL
MRAMMNQHEYMRKNLQQNEDLAELRAATSIAKQQFSDMNKKNTIIIVKN